jgi:hypothetical protein
MSVTERTQMTNLKRRERFDAVTMGIGPVVMGVRYGAASLRVHSYGLSMDGHTGTCNERRSGHPLL